MSQIKETNCIYTKCKSCQVLFVNGLLTKENIYSLELINKFTSFEDLEEVLSNIRADRTSKTFSITPEFLAPRNQMLDWMRFVCRKLNLYDRTFFTAVDLFNVSLDKFKSLSNDDLHLIAITCIFIASKIHETNLLQLDFISSQVGQNRFEKDDYLMTELLILKTINFKIPNNYFLDFVNCIMKIILPTINCKCSFFIYNYIKSNYIANLFDIGESDVIKKYFMIMYQSILVLKEYNILSVGVIARLNQIAKASDVTYNELLKLSYNNASMAIYG
jgi:hypothetical protein